MLYDVIIVGSGPAGVSAAFPLIEAGLNVLMLDGGKQPSIRPPAEDYISTRISDPLQWKQMLGEHFFALQSLDDTSPKTRVPLHEYVFSDFANENKIKSEHFNVIGSLATGGLSNAWGCGVSGLSEAELKAFPCDGRDLEFSLGAVASRIGISGGSNDDLSAEMGLDPFTMPGIEMDLLCSSILQQYSRRHGAKHIVLGQSRVAALSSHLDGREACDRSGNCLWGCDKQALYKANYDLRVLTRNRNFHFCSGFLVDSVVPRDDAYCVYSETSYPRTFRARRVILAAGTIASTRLALKALNHKEPVPLQSCPSAAFLLCLPRYLGLGIQRSFGLSQISFLANLSSGFKVYGSLFNTAGILVSEFSHHIPLTTKTALNVLRLTLPSCLAGNLFLPGFFSDSAVTLDKHGFLNVTGRHKDLCEGVFLEAKKTVSESFRHLGAFFVPGSFKKGGVGADVHYAATMPMSYRPKRGQTDIFGELAGLPGVYVADGGSLPFLPAKPHTLIMMANADRMARHLSKRFRSGDRSVAT